MKSLLILLIIAFLISCSKNDISPKVKLAINPWPGYEFLYLASEKDFFAHITNIIDLLEKNPELITINRLNK